MKSRISKLHIRMWHSASFSSSVTNWVSRSRQIIIKNTYSHNCTKKGSLRPRYKFRNCLSTASCSLQLQPATAICRTSGTEAAVGHPISGREQHCHCFNRSKHHSSGTPPNNVDLIHCVAIEPSASVIGPNRSSSNTKLLISLWICCINAFRAFRTRANQLTISPIVLHK